ncbi:hypothetical protein MBAV_002490 [Candidatus Magnetobacterium bavaricum]|uniref:Uncharacterized protein n=1 Tax=Candidatus Magnetobacterium bavaricum TaxID=29290 RepID=A0A0F3GU24_9BACT|nr:hypothetical protein MBAV_002490 [Candidatus Magnetobacterium bavaricum]
METQPLDRDFDLTEIINAMEAIGPSPFGKHQNISSNIYDIQEDVQKLSVCP